MTIHHDKLAYGKLASMSEEFSEELLLQMVQSLSENEEEKLNQENPVCFNENCRET